MVMAERRQPAIHRIGETTATPVCRRVSGQSALERTREGLVDSPSQGVELSDATQGGQCVGGEAGGDGEQGVTFTFFATFFATFPAHLLRRSLLFGSRNGELIVHHGLKESGFVDYRKERVAKQGEKSGDGVLRIAGAPEPAPEAESIAGWNLVGVDDQQPAFIKTQSARVAPGQSLRFGSRTRHGRDARLTQHR